MLTNFLFYGMRLLNRTSIYQLYKHTRDSLMPSENVTFIKQSQLSFTALLKTLQKLDTVEDSNRTSFNYWNFSPTMGVFRSVTRPAFCTNLVRIMAKPMWVGIRIKPWKSTAM